MTSAVMAVSTVGFAAAANYPAPFVVGSSANVAVVYGANALPTDAVQAGNIQTNLQSQLGGGTTSITTTCAGGDCYLYEMASTKLNLNDTLRGVKSSALDDVELPNVLADGTYVAGDSNSYGYNQEISIWDSDATLQYAPFADKDFDDKKPHVGIHIDKNDYVMNYTVSWKKSPESDVDSAGRLEDFENSKLTMLGKEYTILNAYNASVNSNRMKLELMGGAVVSSVNRDESVSHTLDGATYTIRPAYIADTTCKLCVSIDGGAEEACSVELEKGETTKLSNGIQLGVRAINYASKSGTIDSVDFSLGAEKLTLEHTQTVELNDEDVDNLDVYVSQSASGSQEKMGNIVFQWRANDEYFVAENGEVLFPGLGGVKLASGGFYTPKAEEITVQAGGSQYGELVIPITDGTATIPLLYGNETDFSHIGSDTDKLLVTTNQSAGSSGVLSDWTEILDPLNLFLNLSTNNDIYFVASWNSTTDHESYFLSLKSVSESSGINYTKVQNEVTGETKEAESGNDLKFGNVILTTSGANGDDESVTIAINAGGSFQRVYSSEGAVFYLPAEGNSTVSAEHNISVINVTSATDDDNEWILRMIEEDKDGNLGAGERVNFTLGWSGNRVRVSNIRAIWGSDSVGSNDPDLETEDDSNKYTDWILSDLGTQITMDKPTGSDAQYSADIVYHGDETYGLVYVAGADADVGEVSSGTTTTTAQLGDIVVMDSEVSSVASKNLIVVGGTCINAAAAKALDVATGTCGAAFTDATGVGSGEYLIESVGDVYATGKIALVVAGYNAADTVNAAKALTTQAIDTTAGKKYKGTTSTNVEAVVAAA